MPKITILNSSGASHTSEKNALRYVTTGRAVYVTRRSIRFIEQDYRHQSCRVEATISNAVIDRLIRQNRPGGTVWWNGAQGHHGQHLPFTASVFPRVR